MLPFEQIFLFHTDYTPFSRVVISVCPSFIDFLHQNQILRYEKAPVGL
jgi:hypothetical protein